MESIRPGPFLNVAQVGEILYWNLARHMPLTKANVLLLYNTVSLYLHLYMEVLSI